VTTWYETFCTVVGEIKVTCCVLLHGAGDPELQTLTLPKLPWSKFAVTFIDELMVTMHCVFVPALAQAPPQPVNVDPVVGLAVSVTANPL
jgi:hypothetical protein